MTTKPPIFDHAEAQARTRHHTWGSLTWLAGNAAGLTLGRTVIKAGQQNPRH